MKLSIVSPVYNDPRIERAFQSVLSQNVVTPEIVVVDGGSTDETVTVLDSYRDFIDHLIREPDHGVYHAMNKGIEVANGEVIGILNADDRYQDKSVLSDVVRTFKDSGVSTCYGDIVYVNERNEPVRVWRSGQYRPRRFYLGWMPPHPTFFVKRELYDRLGKFDLSFSIAADYELMLRYLVREGVSTTYIDRTLVRMESGGLSNRSVRNILRANAEVYRAWGKNDLRGGYLAPVIKPLRKVPQYFA